MESQGSSQFADDHFLTEYKKTQKQVELKKAEQRQDLEHAITSQLDDMSTMIAESLASSTKASETTKRRRKQQLEALVGLIKDHANVETRIVAKLDALQRQLSLSSRAFELCVQNRTKQQ